jgi:hypothetical protein
MERVAGFLLNPTAQVAEHVPFSCHYGSVARQQFSVAVNDPGGEAIGPDNAPRGPVIDQNERQL